jgi:uncharacterized protein YyaL (SSP411 family)
MIGAIAVSKSVYSALDDKSSSRISWQAWSDENFAKATSSRKLIILDLEAVWCHWCHVMEETTYSDLNVIQAMKKDFIAVKADQDARPDLSRRYEDYGWPATIIFDGSGKELAKRRGYIEPAEMLKLLQMAKNHPEKIQADETTQQAPLNLAESELTKNLRAKISEAYDEKEGGLQGGHKYLDHYLIEDQINQALAGDAIAKVRARQTLNSARNLIDPVWGGAYQYSVDGKWTEPHFEKIMSFQSDFITSYAFAYAAWADPHDRKSAEQIVKYIDVFLTSPDGAFYTSQDADVVQGHHSAKYFELSDIERRKQGIPRVDKNIYTRENGWMIDAMTRLYEATGEKTYLERARKSAEWIQAHRQSKNELFNHGENSAQIYLGDQIAIARGFLSLYSATGDLVWLDRSKAALTKIENKFESVKSKGFLTTMPKEKEILAPVANLEENLSLARTAILLYHYSGDKIARGIAERAFSFVTSSGEMNEAYMAPGILLAQHELANPPLHIAVVGSRKEALSRELFNAGLAYPSLYKRVDLQDPSEAILPNSSVKYPVLAKPSAFVCSGVSCSSPISDANALRAKVDRILER